MVSDSPELQELLEYFHPGLTIVGVAKPSGQRVVYYCDFASVDGSPDGIPDGEVVLKVAKHSDANQIAYFQREIDLLESVSSPYYPRLFFNDAYREDPRTDTVFDSLLFVTVEERVAALPISTASARLRDECAFLRVFQQMVEALTLLWEQTPPVVHRDLKPDNILISNEDRITIIDLGITRVTGTQGETHTGLMGPCTPGYCSPEQAVYDRRQISYKSDFFCLGVVAYELLTGIHPFIIPNESAYETLERVLSHAPRSPAQLAGVSASLSSLIMRLMEKEAHKRPRTPRILSEAIAALKREICND